MKISLQWLKKYVDLDGISVEEIAQALPMLGLEVEEVESTGMKPLKGVVVGEILSRQAHPNSDHLGVCMVKVSEGGEDLQIVCGASNYKPGDRVPVALEGAELPDGKGGTFKIKASKLRGVDSCAMMCSARELGLGDDHSGLLILDSRPEIGTPINEVFSDSDTVFNIEITANRGDCLSHIGVARELAAKFGRKLALPELKCSPTYSDVPGGGALKSVELQTPNCPLYTAVTIRGVKIGESPQWLRRDLEAAGMRPINNVVDVTNYVMLEYGQPLHAFDARDLRGGKIIVRSAGEGEKITTLDGKEHELTKEATLICDAEGGIAIAGVMGGLNSEVKPDTADIVLESAYFKPGNVRATSRRLAIFTDAAYRYARDVDPQGVFDASRRAADLIVETAGGRIEERALAAGKPPRGERSIDITLDYIIDRIGFAVSEGDAADCFRRLGFSVEQTGAGAWRVTVPSFRSDVDRPIDLVEEFVRIWGTEKLPECGLESSVSTRDDDPLFTFQNAAADFLAARGLNECKNYTLVDGARQAKTWENSSALRLENPLTSDQDCLRASLLDGLIDCVRLNFSAGNYFLGFFENGKIFKADADSTIAELASCAFVLAPDCGQRKWKTRDAIDFNSTKATAFDVLSILGINAENLNFKPLSGGFWEEGYAAQFGSENREGFRAQIGAVSTALLRELGIEKPLWAAEITFKPEVPARKKGVAKFKQLSVFPPAVRDVALIVPADKPAGEVAAEVSKIAKAKLKGRDFEAERVALFDCYRGKGIPEDSKSLAFEISMRSKDRTLQTEEVNDAFEQICAELSKRFALRG